MLDASPRTGLRLPVGVGRRVVVVANLLLRAKADTNTTTAANAVARSLDTWEGPGILALAGNLVDLRQSGDRPSDVAHQALAAHPELEASLRRFAAADDRSVVWLPGAADAAVGDDPATRRIAEDLGAEVADHLDLELQVTAGTRLVRVESGVAPDVPVAPGPDGASITPGAARPPVPTTGEACPWQEGVDRLSEPLHLQRFLTSRLLYRRFARLSWYLLVPFVVVALLRLPVSTGWLGHLLSGHPLPTRAIHQARYAAWESRLLVAAGISVVGLGVLAAVLTLISRRAWTALGGGTLGGIFGDELARAGTTANDPARAVARALVERGYSGFVTGATLQAELTHLGRSFFACAGTTGEVVEEHAGRLGLPPVFLHHRQFAWVEIETGAELHARLLLGRADVRPATVLERLAARYRPAHDTHPIVVAAHPNGT